MDGSPGWLQVIRDVAIIILAVETIVVIAITGVLVFVILKLVKMPKGQLSEAIHELVGRKLVRHIAHHKAARYFVVTPEA